MIKTLNNNRSEKLEPMEPKFGFINLPSLQFSLVLLLGVIHLE